MRKLSKEKIDEMFDLQNKLNIMTCGEQWRNGYTKEKREIDWYRCIYMETAELIDSFNWKHWKNINVKPDLENAYIEIVDIWHFVMSAMIEEFGLNTAKKRAYLTFKHFLKYDKDEDWYKEKTLFYFAEELILSSIKTKDSLDLVASFFELLYKLDNFTMNEVYKLYIGKNVLNQFRQDHGYKEGSYKKIWDGVEDNVFMQKYLETHDDVNYADIYQYLKSVYK